MKANTAPAQKIKVESKPAPVPLKVQKRAKRDAKASEDRTTRRKKAVATAGEKRKEYATRAEKYANEYKAKAKSLVDELRKARAANSFYVPAEAKVALVVRIRGINCLSPTVRKILQLFRLR